MRPGAALVTMRRLSAHGLPVIHYFRPLVPSNTDEETLHRVLSTVAGSALCTVHVGLKLNPNLAGFYRADPVLSPALGTGEEYGTATPQDAVSRLRAIAAERWPDYPLYDRTSCAMAYVLGESDYTATYGHPRSCLPARCPDHQRRACSTARRMPSVAEAEVALHRIGLPNRVVVTDDAIHIDGEVSQEDYLYLLHAFSVPIFASVRFFRVFRGDIFTPNQ